MENRDLERERTWILREKYNNQTCAEYHADIARLEAGEPVDYIIGFSYFLGMRIDLSYRTLIPRSETEYWVNLALSELERKYGKESPVYFLDIFSGSGCIGLALLKHFPNSRVCFADIDPRAILQIKKNLDLASVDPKRFEIYESDVCVGIPSGSKFDAIFANPPYIAGVETVQGSVLAHEPHTALFAEDSGLFLIKKTLDSARSFMKEECTLYIEYDAGQEQDIASYLQHLDLGKACFLDDQYGLSRWVRVENTQNP